MTRDQLIKGMLARQRQLLKLRSKPMRRSSDKVIDRIVSPKGRSRGFGNRAIQRYQRRRLGKLGPASEVRVIMKDGKPAS
jgi:hypothetical protein